MLRMKSRFSIIIENNSDVEIRIDLTSVRQGNNVNNIQIMIPNFELEIDFNKKKTLTAAKEKKYMETLLNYINFVKKIIDQTNIIISNEDKINVLSVYNKLLLQDSKINSKYLYGNQTKSLEVVHLKFNFDRFPLLKVPLNSTHSLFFLLVSSSNLQVLSKLPLVSKITLPVVFLSILSFTLNL